MPVFCPVQLSQRPPLERLPFLRLPVPSLFLCRLRPRHPLLGRRHLYLQMQEDSLSSGPRPQREDLLVRMLIARMCFRTGLGQRAMRLQIAVPGKVMSKWKDMGTRLMHLRVCPCSSSLSIQEGPADLQLPPYRYAAFTLINLTIFSITSSNNFYL